MSIDPNTESAAELCIEDLVEQFLAEIRMGARPTIQSYKDLHPQLAEEIDELFPVVAAMEGWKEQETAARGGRNSLGGVTIERLGDFRMVREIGRGGMGIVFEAVQESLNRSVAIKILPPLDSRRTDSSGGTGERFRREAQTAAALHHSNIVPVFGIGSENDFNYIVMQLIDGCGLDAILKPRSASALENQTTKKRRFEVTEPFASPLESIASHTPAENPLLLSNSTGIDPRFAAKLGVQAANAIHYAHENGILHRDIKPANLLLDRKGHLWVADFGLAKALEHQTLSHSGDLVGTLMYMAPERLRGRCDARSDIYSLGVTLLELVTGRAVFDPRDSGALIERILKGFSGRNDELPQTVPKELKHILLKSIAADPADRYQTALEFADDLNAFIEDRPIRAKQATRLEEFRRMCRRNPLVATLSLSIVGLLVLTVALTSAGLLQQRRMRNRTEATLNTTLNSLDKIYTNFAGKSGDAVESLASGAVLSDETAAMLTELLAVYDELASQGGDTSLLERESLNAQLRVAEIQTRLGRFDQAVVYFERASLGIRKLNFSSDEESRAWMLKQAIATLSWSVAAELQGETIQSQNLRDRALDQLRILERRWPEDPDILLTIARTYFQAGKTDASVDSGMLTMFAAHHRGRPAHEHRNQMGAGNFRRPWGDGPPPDAPGHRRPVGFDPQFHRLLQPPFSPEPPRGRGGRAPGSSGNKSSGPDALERGGLEPLDRHHERMTVSQRDPAKDKFRQNSLGRALDFLTRAETVRGVEPESVLLRALILREQARFAQTAEYSLQIMDKAISLLQDLVDRFPQTAEYQLQLARTLMQAVQLEPSEDLESLTADENYLSRAVEMLQSLHEGQPQISEYAATLAQVSELLGLVSKKLADRDLPERRMLRMTRAEELLRSAVDLQTERCKRQPTSVAEQLWLARFEISLALIVAGRSDPQETRESLDRIRESLRSIQEDDAFAEIITSMEERIDRVEKNPPPPRRRLDGNGAGTGIRFRPY